MKYFLFLLILLLPLAIVSAQETRVTNPSNSAIELPNPLATNSIIEFLDKLYENFLKFVAAPLTVILIIWGAFQMLTAGGSEDKVKSGRNTIKWAVIGLGLLLMVKIIASIIQELFRGLI